MGIAGDNLHFERGQCGASSGDRSDRIGRGGSLDSYSDLAFRPVLRSCGHDWFNSYHGGQHWSLLGGNAFDRLVRFGVRRIRKPEVTIVPEYDAQRQ